MDAGRDLDAVRAHYERYDEATRFDDPLGEIELVRTCELLRTTEREPTLLGASPHLLAVGRADRG